MDRSEAGAGWRVALAKLTDSGVIEMRLLREQQGLSWRELGRRFGVSDVAARRAVLGLGWKHVAAKGLVPEERELGELPSEVVV